MKITVQDCLKFHSLDGAEVLAAENNLNRIVKRVSVLDATLEDDVIGFCGGKDQLVLTSFFGMRADEESQCNAIKALADKETAALVIFNVGKIVKNIPKKVINTAEKCGLPLIVPPLTETFDMGSVIAEISSKLLLKADLRSSLIGNTILHLLNFEKYSNFAEAARAAALSNDFQLILLSGDFNPVLSIETRHRTTIAEAIRIGKAHSFDKTDAPYRMIDVNGIVTYWGSVMIEERTYTMFIVDNEDVYSADEITKLAGIIEIAMGMWKFTPKLDSRAELIKSLRRGNLNIACNFKEEAQIDADEILSVFYSRGASSDKVHYVMDKLEENDAFDVIRLEEGKETYGMILAKGDRREKKETLLINLETLKGMEETTFFHVTSVNGLQGAGEAYRLINETWAYAKQVFPYKSMFTKYEMSLILNCIGIQLQGGYVKKNFFDLLKPFNTFGEKGRMLLDTLQIFVLDADMNVNRAAETMHVHGNTIQYRLKKIYDVLGTEIAGNRVLPGLTVALALKRMMPNQNCEK